MTSLCRRLTHSPPSSRRSPRSHILITDLTPSLKTDRRRRGAVGVKQRMDPPSTPAVLEVSMKGRSPSSQEFTKSGLAMTSSTAQSSGWGSTNGLTQVLLNDANRRIMPSVSSDHSRSIWFGMRSHAHPIALIKEQNDIQCQ
jgi:hypothetical protein